MPEYRIISARRDDTVYRILRDTWTAGWIRIHTLTRYVTVALNHRENRSVTCRQWEYEGANWEKELTEAKAWALSTLRNRDKSA